MAKSNEFRIIIAGSRNFGDFLVLEATMDYLLSEVAKRFKIIVVSGKADGADKLGEMYAKKKGYKIEEYPADWNTLGKRAGYVRNVQMAEVADACAVFCINDSKGSMHMYNICVERNIQVDISKFYTEQYLKDNRLGVYSNGKI